MDNILCEAVAGGSSGGMAIAAAIGAGVVAGGKGVQALWARRNGQNCKPGHTQACINHTTRVAVLESQFQDIREDLKEIKQTLDKVLERR